MDPSSDEITTVNLAQHIGPDTTDEEAINNHFSSFMAHIRTEAPLRCHAKYCKMYLPPQFDTNDTKTRKKSSSHLYPMLLVLMVVVWF